MLNMERQKTINILLDLLIGFFPSRSRILYPLRDSNVASEGLQNWDQHSYIWKGIFFIVPYIMLWHGGGGLFYTI